MLSLGPRVVGVGFDSKPRVNPMRWFISRASVGIASFVISASLSFPSFSQEVERVNNPKLSPPRPPGTKRVIPKLVIGAEDRDILLKSLANTVRDAEEQTDPQQRVNALVNLACGQFLANDHDAALATLAKANEAVAQLPGDLTRALSWTMMATQLGEYGAMAEARTAVASAVKMMNSLSPTNRISVAKGVSRAEAMIGADVGAKGVLETALEGLMAMTSESQWQRSLAMLVDGLLDAEDFDRVLDIAEAIPDVRIELRGMQIGKVAGKATQVSPEAAKATLSRALKIASAISSDPVKAEALSSIAVAQAETGDIDGAIATAAMIGKGVNDPSVDVFKPVPLVAIAVARAKVGNLEKARESFALAIKLAQAIGNDNAEIRSQRLQAIAANQAKINLLADAVKTADMIKGDEFHKSLALSEIGNAQIARKDFPGAIASFRKALELAKEIKVQANAQGDGFSLPQQQAFYEIACGLAAAKDFAEALKVADLAMAMDPNRRTFHSLYALSQIAGERAWTGDIDGALKGAEAIEDEWNRINAYERIAKLEGEAGGVAHACGWIAKVDDPKLRIRFMWSVIKGLAKRSSNLRQDLPDLGKSEKKEPAK